MKMVLYRKEQYGEEHEPWAQAVYQLQLVNKN